MAEEAARACEAAGFGASAPAAPASAPSDDVPRRTEALPETGGSGGPVAALIPLALLVGGLLAFGVVRRTS